MLTSTRLYTGLLCTFVSCVCAIAQAPTGQVDGRVFDETGALIPSAVVTLTNTETGASRKATSGGDGIFSFPSLQAGKYEMRCEAPGFRTQVQPVTIQTGAISTADIHMQVGQSKEVVTVEALATQLDFDRQTIDGVVTRQQIDSLPLNGRSFLQLAQLQPGVSVSPGNIGQYNRQFDVSVLGRGSESVRITVDGATVNDPVTGGTQQNFSQDVIQEFQISSANFDLSTGITGGGAVNIVTRGGGNDFHGAGYFFFRDHNMAAYPYLQRSAQLPNPFFARRDPGVFVGGPVIKDKLFFFSSYEHNNQRSAQSAFPTDPLFSAFAAYTTSPYNSNQFTERLDYRVNEKHSMFLRYSHDGNNTFSPSGDQTQPSNWGVNTNWADSGVFSVISALTASTTNEFRFSNTYWSNSKNPPTPAQCPGCPGVDGPQINLVGINGFQIGNDANNTPQSRVLRRYIAADNYSWQKGSHSLKFGGEWEYQKGTGTYAYAEPGGMYLYSPEIVSYYNSQVPAPFQIQIPSSFTTLQDVLQLPVALFYTGVGDINQPPSYNRGNADHNHRLHFFAQDNWRMSPKLTLIFGLGYSYESDLLNHDLPKPQYLEPILGPNGIGREQHQNHNWSPALGFAWNVGSDNKTVVRGGAGIYYDTMNLEVRLLERAAIGPLGTGRVLLYDPTFFPAIDQLFGINANLPPPLQVGSLSDHPTVFTGADLSAILPLLRAGVAQQLHQNPTNTDLSIRNINVFKTSPGLDLFVNDYRPPYSQQASIGVQRQVTNDVTVSADFVYRHFLRERIRNTDLNHYLSVKGPVIPPCLSAAQALDPTAECSTGRIDFDVSGGRTTYKGLLLRVDKRFSRRFMFTASYAYASLRGFNDLVQESNWFASNGPTMGRQNLTFSGTWSLPWGFTVSTITTFGSSGPFEPVIPNVDLLGDGTTHDLPLPGGGYNEFGITKGHSDLVRLVNQFNQLYAGTKSPRGQNIPLITLPASYSFGRNSTSEDFRVTKDFKLHTERAKLQIFGEVFNAFNYANLTGYNTDLTASTFGQPTGRASQILGSGGPRVFQVGVRLAF
jgi:hypothetical protein